MYLNQDTLADAQPRAPLAPPPRGIATSIVARIMRTFEAGRLTVVTPDGARIEHRGPLPGQDATIVIHRWRALGRILAGGDIGFAEGYLAGDWSSPDLTAFIALAADNIERLKRTMDGFAPVRLFNRLRHSKRVNSPTGSRRNIAFHYDLGNDFYRLWLDESMTYSSALAVHPGHSLEAAQAEKLARIAELMRLTGDETVLEIGCGWGALAAHLAPHARQVTGITLSREQLAIAQARRSAAEFRLQDYRDLAGTFDRIVSIEMLEAVGERYWPVWFDTVSACLAPGGTAVVQVITMREDRFEDYRSGTDFIQKYVFPGGMLPSPGIIAREAERAGLAIASVETFRKGYAATLAEWRRRFEAAWPEIERLGFDERFHRMWTYYLSYCEAGFDIGTIDVGLYVLEKRA
jgi:cyclopropane-fatty-acyl-phospholipid synthase